MIARDEATENQVRAARPDASTWLAANAGSGKTRVLTDRVARLLLEGVEPQSILCLTYTKAAASEMQNRLFQRLGAWAMLPDDRLEEALGALGAGHGMSPERMRHARTLFARAIEAPGGLKIQTIHSFCAGLLRRFPLEAGISPQFKEMEDRAGRLLRAQIVEDFADGPQRELIDTVARYLSDVDFDAITQSIIGNREAFEQSLSRDALADTLDLPATYNLDDLETEVFQGDEQDILTPLIAKLKTGSSLDQSAAAKLDSASELNASSLPTLESVFLFGDKAASPFGAKIGTFPKKAFQKELANLLPSLDAFMARVEQARDKRLALLTIEKSLALHGFAQAFLPEFERRKQMRGWLDFDDQILKARQLLNDPAVAAWVLFRLDGGIDHILVDEAQDTSPEQWDVIEKLAQEFTSGEGARSGIERTIFVVGDKKQSIYSFQGADPREFDRMQREFEQRLKDVGQSLQSQTLAFSFRSAETLLRLVDIVFTDREDAGFAKNALHRAFKKDLPGRVDLWPLVEKVDDKIEQHWTDPVDRPSPRSHTVVLAEQIADQIRRLINEGETIPDEAEGRYFRRPVEAGDFLILVQRRSDLFEEIIRACKAADLPIAGADRLKIGAELAVRDLGALLKFVATPEDDLSLACALKSPLFGWSEQDLFTLAHKRAHKFLWQCMRAEPEKYTDTLSILSDLRNTADFLRPYDLIERVLTRHGGRQQLLGRLGVEAEDGINALLGQALAYERSENPNLTGFLGWMETDDLEIKRQLGQVSGKIRVMTVHGAKGLESPIVILPDTAKRSYQDRNAVVFADGIPFWKPRSDEMPALLVQARAESRERQEQERQRLLYVALTRAEKWLIIAAAGELDKNGTTWYQQVECAMRKTNAISRNFPVGAGLSLEDDAWSDLPIETIEPPAERRVCLPELFNRAASAVTPEPETLSPSDLGGAKALPGAEGQDEEAAKLYGSRVHLLLEHLPRYAEAEWQEFAKAVLQDCDAGEVATLLNDARRVLHAPAIEHLFSANYLSEIPVSAEIGGRRIHGVIDHLIITADKVLAVDFKSNAVVPTTVSDCPDGLLRQMGAYAAALSQIYPGREVETAILWTKTAQLMMLPHDVVISALKHTPHLDL